MITGTTKLIKQASRKLLRPDDSAYDGLPLAKANEVSEKTRTSLKEIEAEALRLNILPERYGRNQKTLDCADQLTLLQSHVAIIGLGGLGGVVTELLARIGVGKITLVDGDVFDESNLNRQLLSSVASLGQAKAAVAAARVQSINPAVETVVFEEFFSLKNGAQILSNATIAVDCLDTITDRFALEQVCTTVNIPMVSAAIGGTTGQATTVFPGDIGLQAVYGSGKRKKKGIEASVGTLSFAAFYMAAVECAEVTRILLTHTSALRGKLYLAEVSEHFTDLVSLGNG